MDVLVQKPKGQLKAWTLAGIIAIIVFYVCYVSIDLFYFQAYGDQLTGFEYAGFFVSYNGIFTTVALVFLIGLFTAKKRAYFLQFMLWAMMLTGFFYAMPGINNLFQYFLTYSGLALMYYMGLYLPQILFSVLLVSVILQKDSENKSVTNMIAWISIVADIVLIVFQLVNIFSSGQAPADFNAVIVSLATVISIAVSMLLSFVFLTATKTPSEKRAKKEAALDNLVENVAEEPQKEEANPEDLVEKIDRGED